jgi:hypothetical protein
MPLNWNITQCQNHEELLDDSVWGKTDALIWTTMVIGIPEITEDNADEFFARVETVQRVTGNLCIWNGDPYYFDYQDIVRRIGLHTNASRLTKAGFFKHVTNISDYNLKKAKSLYEDALKSIPVKA